jgi:hypothetical protein
MDFASELVITELWLQLNRIVRNRGPQAGRLDPRGRAYNAPAVNGRTVGQET